MTSWPGRFFSGCLLQSSFKVFQSRILKPHHAERRLRFPLLPGHICRLIVCRKTRFNPPPTPAPSRRHQIAFPASGSDWDQPGQNTPRASLRTQHRSSLCALQNKPVGTPEAGPTRQPKTPRGIFTIALPPCPIKRITSRRVPGEGRRCFRHHQPAEVAACERSAWLCR